MFKKLFFALLLVIVAAQFAAPTVYAMGEPSGSCAPGFNLEMAMGHDEHHHKHVGTDTDINGDGYICVAPVTPDNNIHVHVDNNLP